VKRQKDQEGTMEQRSRQRRHWRQSSGKVLVELSERLQAHPDQIAEWKIRVSMDSQGCLRKGVFIERPWKTVKYGEVCLKAHGSIVHAKKEPGRLFDSYDMRRPHQGLDDRTPDEVCWSTLPGQKDAVWTGAANHLKTAFCCLVDLESFSFNKF